MKKECRLSGSGGQGIILAGIILAEAAAIHEGHHVVQTQDYGPAARGDSSKTDVIISSDPIIFPKCQRLDLLVALSQRAYDENILSVKRSGIIIIDSEIVRPSGKSGIVRLPMTRLALDCAKSPLSVNMVALGAVAAVTGIVRLESIEKSMCERVPPHTQEHNHAALLAGFQAGQKTQKAKKHAG